MPHNGYGSYTGDGTPGARRIVTGLSGKLGGVWIGGAGVAIMLNGTGTAIYATGGFLPPGVLSADGPDFLVTGAPGNLLGQDYRWNAWSA